MNNNDPSVVDPADSLSGYRNSRAIAALPTIRIVHLSDLHFVTHPLLRRLQAYSGLHGHDDDTRQALENQVVALKPHLLFATGDHSTWGDKSSLRSARKFLVALAQKAGLDDQRIFWVAGNHDVLLHYYCGLPFVTRNHDQVFGKNQAARDLQIDGYRLAVFSFDSTLQPDRRSVRWPLVGSMGKISKKSFNEFNQALQSRIEINECFKIAQVHHHPLPIPYKGGNNVGPELTTMTNGGTFIAYMQESGMQLVLHGHEHIPYSCCYSYDPNHGQIIVVAAGTACQRATQQNSFNYLEIVPRNRIVIREYKHTEVGFRLDQGSTKVFAFQKT